MTITRITRKPPVSLLLELHRFLPFGWSIEHFSWELLPENGYVSSLTLTRERSRYILVKHASGKTSRAFVYDRISTSGFLKLISWILFSRRP